MNMINRMRTNKKGYSRKLVFGASVVGVLLGSCSQSLQSDVPIVAFDLSAAKPMKMSEFVQSITLIPLETNDSSLVKDVKEFQLSENGFHFRSGNCYLSFDSDGKFLHSTQSIQGFGPQQYRTAVSGQLLPGQGVEIFDPFPPKLKTYDDRLQLVSEHKLPEEILPASGCLYLSLDYRLFTGEELKLYAVSEKKIVDTYQCTAVPHFGYLSPEKFLRQDGRMYFSPPYENILYECRMDSSAILLIPVCQFDFGVRARFEKVDLPKDESDSYYRQYIQNNTHLAFVNQKYADGDKRMCFFVYDNKSCFAYQDASQGLNQVYYNVVGSKRQFLPAHLYQRQCFYYVCQPQYLDYVVDTSLMSRKEQDKRRGVQEDDNPVVVCYHLK